MVVRVVEPGLLGAISSHNLQLALQKFHELLSDFVVSLHVLELRRLNVVSELLKEIYASLKVLIYLLNQAFQVVDQLGLGRIDRV